MTIFRIPKIYLYAGATVFILDVSEVKKYYKFLYGKQCGTKARSSESGEPPIEPSTVTPHQVALGKPILPKSPYSSFEDFKKHFGISIYLIVQI